MCPLFVLLLLVWLQAGYVSAGGSFVFDRVFDEVLSMLTAPMRADIDVTPLIDADMRTHPLCRSTSRSLRRTCTRLRLRTWSGTSCRALPSPFSHTVTPPIRVCCAVKFSLVMTDVLVTGVCTSSGNIFCVSVPGGVCGVSCQGKREQARRTRCKV